MAGITYDGMSSTLRTSSTYSGTSFLGDTGSFATGVRSPTIANTTGTLRSAGTGSPSTFGAFVQGGTVVTTAGSAGTIEFGTAFATTSWFGILTAGSVGGVNQAYISGTRNVSGAAIVGGPSITYNYLAIGA